MLVADRITHVMGKPTALLLVDGSMAGWQEATEHTLSRAPAMCRSLGAGVARTLNNALDTVHFAQAGLKGASEPRNLRESPYADRL